jgi:mono/diheme cytochrome c family protein
MHRTLFITIALGALASGAAAQDQDHGAREYVIACAGCHGETGMGDGPLAGLLDIETPNLTTLAARAGGAFPYAETLRMVDGRNEVRAHGSAMPVWGDRFFVTAAVDDGRDPAQSDLVAKGRVLALVSYLASIQAE